MTILAAIDLTSSSDDVIRAIPQVANQGETVIMLHVADPEPDFVGFDPGPDVVREQIEKEFSQQQEQLENFAETVSLNAFKVTATQKRGASAAVIMETADQHDVRMIIMGNRRHGTVYDILVGSVAEEVIRAAAQPVLMVPKND